MAHNTNTPIAADLAPPPYTKNASERNIGALAGSTAPTPSSNQDDDDRTSWWRRKTCWVVMLGTGFLVLFVVVFVPVYVTRQQNKNTSSESRATPTTSPEVSPEASPEPTGPLRPTGPLSACSGTDMLDPVVHRVPRDIGLAAGEPFQLLVWDLRAGGELWRKEYAGEWEEELDRWFLFAPVVVKTSGTTQTAFSVDARSGHIVWQFFAFGQWDDKWHVLETECSLQFLSRPSVVSRAEGRIDVFNTDSHGGVWVVSYDGSTWSEWKLLGEGFTGEVSATTWGEDRIDVFARSGDTILHKYWNPEEDWGAEWEDLGDPLTEGLWDMGEEISMPMSVSFLTSENDAIIDLVLGAAMLNHKQFRGGVWGDWINAGASHEGGEFVNTQSLVSGDGIDGRPFAYIISRGTDDCIHYNTLEESGEEITWVGWGMLWCLGDRTGYNGYWPTQNMSTSAVSVEGRVAEFVARDMAGTLLRLDLNQGFSDGRISDIEWEELGQGGSNS